MNFYYCWILVYWLAIENSRIHGARIDSVRAVADDQYFHLNSVADTYHYGYQVNPDGNFHHERRGPEGVTYGCFGYTDSKQKLHVTHYVADRKGFRVIEPNKPIQIYLTNQTAWPAFLLPKGCGRSTDKPNSTGPELIYKPLGAVSTPKPATMSTRRTTTKPAVTQPVSSTTAAPCSCPWPTATKPTVLTPKPPKTTTTIRTTTVSRATSTTTARTTPTKPKTTKTTEKPDRPIVDVDVTIGRPSQYIYRPHEEHQKLDQGTRSQSPSAPLIYYVPYNQSTGPTAVPSTSHGTCGSGFGYIGLAPLFFVPISSAKNLGLMRNNSEFGSSEIPLRKFTKPSDGANWTLTEMLDDDGSYFRLNHSEELEKILNGPDFSLLMQSDYFSGSWNQ